MVMRALVYVKKAFVTPFITVVRCSSAAIGEKPGRETVARIESEPVMRESKQVLYRARKRSDVTLDGLFGGLAGGAMMVVYLVLWGWMGGEPPQTVLGLFDPNQLGVPLTGLLTHLAISAVYGILFGLIWWALHRVLAFRVTAWLAGVAYGLALLTVAKAVILPLSGTPLAEIPTLHFALAHMLYGAVLGFVCERAASQEP